MKILQITNSFHPVIGGQEKVVLEISKGLVKKGHEVTVLTTDYLCEEKVGSGEKFDGIEIVRMKNDLWLAGYGYSPEAMKWLRKNYSKFDVVHCHGYNRYLPEFAVKFLFKKIPVVFTAHGFIHTKKNMIFKKIHDLTIGRVVRKADICTALTELDFLDYEKLGVSKEKILVLPNGVDIEKFSNRDEEVIRKFKTKFKLGKNVLLYVGRIHESKGLQYVVDAIKNIDTTLLIVGRDGGYKKVLEEKIKERGIGEKVIFAGGLSDEEVVAAYQSSDAFVLFSEWEGFGIVIIEAMAANLPVISSDRGAIPYLIKDGKNGLMSEFKNVGALRDNIMKLFGDEKLRTKLIKSGKEFSENYSWEKIVEMVEEIYIGVEKDGI
ncbi:glycosyltransferase family 4 protein [archaeon]|jgi:glycosyltransferase involved in cell wall biosynthesis|nr:glycosyltransferase family 4 protein [archaeon]MBT6182805.1 glycosyltransferase family 4 protein [archaeon]MBT6606105.1 glycosyltransferase family 4 protein [archaeon]MBT7252055.1 glycosyltransferase family 4 protein [archaeon]MBT7660996.1 glycosyltransferase family 4 protein [archaeon]